MSPPSDWPALLTAAVLVLAPGLWPFTRHLVTLVHEAGHAGVAVLTGRRLSGIRLHRDTSGLTVSRGNPRGPGMIATAGAGYLAPTAFGFGGLLLVSAGRTAWAMWIAIGVLGVMLLYIRNWFGLLVVLLAGLSVGVLIWRAPTDWHEFSASVFFWFLLIAGPRTVMELWSHRRRKRSKTTDVDLLARLTRVPAFFWNAVFLIVSAGALAWSLHGLVLSA